MSRFRLPLGGEVVTLFLMTAVGVFVSAALAGDAQGSTQALLAHISIQQVVGVLGTTVLVAWMVGLERSDVFGRWSPGLGWLGAALLLTAGWAILQTPIVRLWADLTGSVAPMWWATAASGDSALDLLAMVVVLAVIPPICEELFFRGVFLDRLRVLGTPLAVVVQAAVFALYHLDPYGAPIEVLAGLFLGLLRVASGSLLPAILAHSANNAVALVELNGAGSTYDQLGWLAWPLGLGALAAGGLWVARLLSPRPAPSEDAG